MTDTLEHRPPENGERVPYEDAALGFLAAGQTSELVRAHAANALHVSRMARVARISTQKAYDDLLLIAAAIKTLEDRGMTREQASLLVPDDLTAA